MIKGLNVGDDTVVALDDDVHFVRHFEQGLAWYSFHFCKFCANGVIDYEHHSWCDE